MRLSSKQRRCSGHQRGTPGTSLSRKSIGEQSKSLHCQQPRCFRFLLIATLLLHFFNRDDFHLWPLCAVQAWMPRSTKSREARYFTKSCLVPPLEHIEQFANSTTLHCDKINTGALPVVYTNDPKTVSEWLNKYVVPAENCVIGFDLESVPQAPWIERRASFQGPAVVQLATPTHALVVHLTKASGRPSRACAPLIESILRNETIVKAGCAIDQDLIELRTKWNGMEARSRLDLGGIGGDKGAMSGLRTLCAAVLLLDLPKSRRLAMSDWSQVPLTDAQLAYCARDAWVGASVAAELEAWLPQIFGPRRLAFRLRAQRSLRDLTERQRNRKQARMLLSAIHAPLAQKQRTQQDTQLPQWKRRVVNELKKVVRENRFDGLEVYEVLELGLEAMGNRTT